MNIRWAHADACHKTMTKELSSADVWPCWFIGITVNVLPHLQFCCNMYKNWSRKAFKKALFKKSCLEDSPDKLLQVKQKHSIETMRYVNDQCIN